MPVDSGSRCSCHGRPGSLRIRPRSGASHWPAAYPWAQVAFYWMPLRPGIANVLRTRSRGKGFRHFHARENSAPVAGSQYLEDAMRHFGPQHRRPSPPFGPGHGAGIRKGARKVATETGDGARCRPGPSTSPGPVLPVVAGEGQTAPASLLSPDRAAIGDYLR